MSLHHHHPSPTSHRRAALIPGDQGLAAQLRAANLADMCLSDSDNDNEADDSDGPFVPINFAAIPTRLHALSRPAGPSSSAVPRKSSFKRPRRPCIVPNAILMRTASMSFSDSEEDDEDSDQEEEEEQVPRRVSFKDHEICHEFVALQEGAVVAAFEQEELAIMQVDNNNNEDTETRGLELARSYPRQQRKFLILKTIVRAQHQCTADQLARTSLICNAWANDAAQAQGQIDYQTVYENNNNVGISSSNTGTTTALPSMGLYALPLKRRERKQSPNQLTEADEQEARRVRRKL